MKLSKAHVDSLNKAYRWSWRRYVNMKFSEKDRLLFRAHERELNGLLMDISFDEVEPWPFVGVSSDDEIQ